MANGTMAVRVGGGFLLDKRRTPNANTDASPLSATTFNATKDMVTLDAALAAANPTYWTAARLRVEGWNDKMYAWRQINDAAGQG